MFFLSPLRNSSLQLEVQSIAGDRCVLDVTITLAERCLPFQGTNEHIGDAHNGPFLAFIEVLPKYEVVLQEHVTKIRESQSGGKPMKVHYLSHTTQNEFINLCSNEVRKRILSDRAGATR